MQIKSISDISDNLTGFFHTLHEGIVQLTSQTLTSELTIPSQEEMSNYSERLEADLIKLENALGDLDALRFKLYNKRFPEGYEPPLIVKSSSTDHVLNSKRYTDSVPLSVYD